MEQVESADGTLVAVESWGEGPPVLVIAGAFCDRTSGASLVSMLASSYRVYTYDRCGRGDSGDHAHYSIQREVEDLDAVVTSIGTAPCAYGHSSGGSLVLEAAALGTDLRKIAVFEPPYTGDQFPGEGFIQQLDELVRDGCRGEAAERFLTLTGAPAGVIEEVKAGPGWPHMVGLAHTLSRDLRLGNCGRVPVARLRHVTVPLLAMSGGSSAQWAQDAVQTIGQMLPSAEARSIEGQHHVPADDVLVPILEAFFA